MRVPAAANARPGGGFRRVRSSSRLARRARSAKSCLSARPPDAGQSGLAGSGAGVRAASRELFPIEQRLRPGRASGGGFRGVLVNSDLETNRPDLRDPNTGHNTIDKGVKVQLDILREVMRVHGGSVAQRRGAASSWCLLVKV